MIVRKDSDKAAPDLVIRLGPDLFDEGPDLDDFDDDLHGEIDDVYELYSAGSPKSVPIASGRSGSAFERNQSTFPESKAKRSSPSGVSCSPAVRRRIMQEVRNGEYDEGIVFDRLQGLVPGSQEFNAAYVDVRTEQYSEQSRPDAVTCLKAEEPYQGLTIDEEFAIRKPKEIDSVDERLLLRNPWVIRSFRDLEAIFGIGFWGWVFLQCGSVISLVWALVDQFYLEPALVVPVAIGLYLAADLVLWARIRMRVYHPAVRPALLVLLAGALIPATLCLIVVLWEVKI
jgi:hypothetical protein